MANENALALFELLKQTPPNKVVELDFVRDKFIYNYNFCNNRNDGDLIWGRNLIFIRQQIESLKNKEGKLLVTNPISVYQVIVTAAAYGISLAPDDEQAYLLAIGGDLLLWKQPGYYVSRLVDTNQIEGIEITQLVYYGGIIKIADGKVVKHEPQFKSYVIVAGYTKIILPHKGERHFIYTQHDWQSWRSHSREKDGANWVYKCLDIDGKTIIESPKPGFLKTKILTHALKDKGNGWKPGRAIMPQVEVYANVMTDERPDNAIDAFEPTLMSESDIPPVTRNEEIKPQAQIQQAPVTFTVPTSQLQSQPQSAPVNIAPKTFSLNNLENEVF